MKDPRIQTLAKNLINYSVKLKKGEKVLIENFGLQRESSLRLLFKKPTLQEDIHLYP